MTENKRLAWLDVAKGFGIILVIYAHIDNQAPLQRFIFPKMVHIN